jgi:hypothetical protein
MQTHEELEAEIAALKAENARLAARPTPAQPVAVPQRNRMIAVPSAMLARRRGKALDPILIQGQIDGLTQIITSGVNSAGYGDKRTEFRSLTELRQILSGLEEDLEGALGYGGRIRQIRMTTSADKAL